MINNKRKTEEKKMLGVKNIKGYNNNLKMS